MIIDFIAVLFYILATGLLVYAIAAVAYVLVFSVASLFPYRHTKIQDNRIRKMAVMIPAYKADLVIEETALSASEQNYPSDKYEVVVISDSMKPETVERLQQLPIRVLEVDFENSNKAKSLNKCMEVLGDNYDVAVILDADNLVEKDFLSRINEAFNRGYRVVQAHRMAKNTDTNIAVLDAASEEINNRIFRKGHRVLGVASALIGSGMAVEYGLYKTMMSQIDAVGEDKELELMLLKERIDIEYLEDVPVYDEKTSEAQNLKKQRSRWFAAQTEYVVTHFPESLKELIRNGNFGYFDKALQFVLPPRIILLAILFVLTVICALAEWMLDFDPILALDWKTWFVLLVLAGISLILALPAKFFSVKTLKAMFAIPKALFMILMSLTQFKKARTHFIATDHQFSNSQTSNKE